MKVRAIIKELNLEGWFQVRQVGSHRQFQHAEKLGTVTVPGALGVELSKATLASIVKQAGLERRAR